MESDGTSRSLLVLGGADGALTTLAAAHRLGLHTICVDVRPAAPGARAADEFLALSTSDVAGITAALADRADVVGVVSPGSDVNLPYQKEIARRLGLPCTLTEASVRISTDKVFFHDVCADLGIATARYVAGDAAHVLRGVGELDGELIVKPNDLGGGRGVMRCTRHSELADALAAAAAWSPTGTVVVEEYVSGHDCGGEVVLVDGAVVLAGITERLMGPPPTSTTIGHVMRPGADDVVAAFRERAGRLCDAVGYASGPANFDLIVTGAAHGGTAREIVMIEMGTRLGGNGVGELLGLVNGVDTTAAAIRAALGERDLVPLGAKPRTYAAARAFHAGGSGRLTALDGVAAARDLPGVADVIVAAQTGDRVEPFTQCRAKAGLVLVVGDDEQALLRRLDDALTTIKVRYEPDPADPRDRLVTTRPNDPLNADLALGDSEAPAA